MTDNEIIKANDILDKLDFFDGQRAGRELWFNKPEEIQNEDIKDFVDDIAFLKDFINRQQAELEKKDVEIDILIRKKETLKDEVSELRAEVERLQKANESFSCLGMLYSEIKAEARKEFAERVTDRISDKLDRSSDNPDGDNYFITDVFADIENLLAEMESERK